MPPLLTPVATREMPTPLTTVATLLTIPTPLTTVATPLTTSILAAQVACAVIEEALEHGLATKISRKEV